MFKTAKEIHQETPENGQPTLQELNNRNTEAIPRHEAVPGEPSSLHSSTSPRTCSLISRWLSNSKNHQMHKTRHSIKLENYYSKNHRIVNIKL